MTLGQVIAQHLPALRAAAESRMTDGCEIRTGSTGNTLDETTGLYTEGTPVFSYTGPCRIKFGQTAPHLVDSAGRLLVVQQVEVHLPVLASADVMPGHVVRITAASKDPRLVGQEFRVAGIHEQTDATARRLPVEVIS